MLLPYEKLSRIYDGFWGKFSLDYVPFIKDITNRLGYNIDTVLDIACGTGSLAIELSKYAKTVVGIDISLEMLQVARAKAKNIPNVRFIQANFRKFQLDETFGIALCCFDSINYAQSLDDVIDMVCCVYRHLERHGLFIFDFVNEKHFERIDGTSGDYEIDGVKYKNLSKYNSVKKVGISEFIFENGREVHRQIPIEQEEMMYILENNGFWIVNIFSSLNQSLVDDETERFFFVVRKG